MTGDHADVRALKRLRPPSPALPAPVFTELDWEETHPALRSWRQNVGNPVLLDLAPPLGAAPKEVDVLCWNLAIGAARLDELLKRLRRPEHGGAGTDPKRPLVILAQEAYRADKSLPPLPIGRFHGGGVQGGSRTDIVEIARKYRMSLRYAPAMRNGIARSDRGNAILATCGFGPTYAFSLPYLRQRRIAIAAELAGLEKLAFVSAHFENRARLRLGLRSAIGLGSSRAKQSEALGRRIIAAEGGDVVLGADLNTARGVRDPAFQSLLRAGFVPALQVRRWNYTCRVGPLRLLLDHVLVHSGHGLIRSAEVERIDGDPGARGRRVLGSDHHPLLARVALRSPATSRDPGPSRAHE
ncbi:hypothetical protein BH23GEM3_BH23GEM3_19440 [soil metagenome]